MAGTAEQRFLWWLREHGARIEKLQWPCEACGSTSRGAMARVDIDAGEAMMEIPLKLIINPARCYENLNLAPVYWMNRDFFEADDDAIIAVFLMHERLKGEESFWSPYLDILPDPHGVGDWSREEQLELQDRDLVGEARRRPVSLQMLYQRIQAMLFSAASDTLEPDDFSFELFRWAWMVIQSRAFGRRLPWTALVPFADCLNHANVQTCYEMVFPNDKVGSSSESKDDFEEEAKTSSSSVLKVPHFKLFPCGHNSYKAGQEAFNSYGRRSNSFLLLEYGFALRNNEWDTYRLTLRLKPSVVAYKAKCNLLRSLQMGRFKTVKLCWDTVNKNMVAFMRLNCMNDDEVVAAQKIVLEEEIPSSNEFSELEKSWFACISKETQLLALKSCFQKVEEELASAGRETSIEQDETLLHSADLPDRFQAAIIYRLGRKRILISHIKMMSSLLEEF